MHHILLYRSSSKLVKVKVEDTGFVFVFVKSRYLDYALDANKIRKQDAISTIVYIASNVEGSKLAWDFVKRHWDRIFAE